MKIASLRRRVLSVLVLAIAIIGIGCDNPAGSDSGGGRGDGQLQIDGVGSFALSYMYLEGFSEEDYYTVYVDLSSQEVDEFDVVPEGADSVWLELRSPEWPLAAGTYTQQLDNGTATPAVSTFEGDVSWGEEWDEIEAESVVTVAQSDGVYTISGDFNGYFEDGGTFSLTATPIILGEPEIPEDQNPEVGVTVEYQATVTGDVTGSFAGSAGVRADNPLEGAYRFDFGIDDLTSEPATSLAWVFVINTFNSDNGGLAEVEYPISGEIGGTLETDVARLYEQTYRHLYIGDDYYRFAGTATSPGSFTLTTVTASSIEGSFSLTGPFEISTGSSWEPAGEATLETTFVIER
ncbi:MAG: hypothetical protein ACLFPW_03390 [Spirochaetaceae bacterium]